jgi:hypothetical protein
MTDEAWSGVMTDEEWSGVLAMLRAGWVREPLPGADILQVWRRLLQSYAPSLVLDRIIDMIESGDRFRPEIGAIIQACKIATLPKQPLFDEFYHELRINASISRWSDGPEAMAWSQPWYLELVRSIGWDSFRNSDGDDAPTRAFVRQCFNDRIDRGDTAVEEIHPELSGPEFGKLLEDLGDLPNLDAIGKIA